MMAVSSQTGSIVSKQKKKSPAPSAVLFKPRRDSALGTSVFVELAVQAVQTSQAAVSMVRTKADSVPGTYRKAVAASAPRKSLGSTAATNSASSSAASTPSKNKYAGGNPVCVRPTPTWQKGIGHFFGGPPRKPEKENQRPQEVDDGEEAGGSGMSKANRKARPLPAEDEDDD